MMFRDILIGLKSNALRLASRKVVNETCATDVEHTRSAQCLRSVVLCLTIILTGVFVSPQIAQANESASFRLYHTTFPGYSSGCASKSGSFCMVEKGITWNKLPLEGSNFQIVTAPPVAVAVAPPEVPEEEEERPGGCRGSGCRSRPPRPAAPPEPEPPVEPPVTPPVEPPVVPPVVPEPPTPPVEPEPPVVPTRPAAPIDVPPELVPTIVRPPFIIVACPEDYYDPIEQLCEAEKVEPLRPAAVPYRRTPIALLLIGYLLLLAALVTRRWQPNEYYDHALHRGKTPEYWNPYPSPKRTRK